MAEGAFRASTNVTNQGSGSTNTHAGPGVQHNTQTQYKQCFIVQRNVYETLRPAFVSSRPAPAPVFVQRPALIKQLTARKARLPNRGRRRIAVHGLGGSGKTQLVLQHVERLIKSSPGTSLYWIHSSDAARFHQDIDKIVDELALRHAHNQGASSLRLLERWLANPTNGPWLVVLDDAHEPSMLLQRPDVIPGGPSQPRHIDYLPACEHGLVLISSRGVDQYLLQIADAKRLIHVEQMTPDEAQSLLKANLKESVGDDVLRDLATELDAIPLTLAQAAVVINQDIELDAAKKYLHELQGDRRQGLALLEKGAPLPGQDRDAKPSLILRWRESFERIYQIRRSAFELLSFMSLCHHSSLPFTLLRCRDCHHYGTTIYPRQQDNATLVPDHDPHRLREDLSLLREYSFIMPVPNSDDWHLLRSVQEAIQCWLDGRCDRRRTENHFLVHLSREISEIKPGSQDEYARYKPHVELALNMRPTDHLIVQEWLIIDATSRSLHTRSA